MKESKWLFHLIVFYIQISNFFQEIWIHTLWKRIKKVSKVMCDCLLEHSEFWRFEEKISTQDLVFFFFFWKMKSFRVHLLYFEESIKSKSFQFEPIIRVQKLITRLVSLNISFVYLCLFVFKTILFLILLRKIWWLIFRIESISVYISIQNFQSINSGSIEI